MTRVVPAIQARTVEEYQQSLRTVRQLTNRFQLDIISSDFNENPTIGIEQVPAAVGMECDVHIMARNPRAQIAAAKHLYPHLIVLQYEGVDGIHQILESLHSEGQAVGVAINPETSVRDIAELLPIVDHVLIMAYPAGPSGQVLQPSVLSKAEQVRKLKPGVEVALDGGVSEDSIGQIAATGFDVVNVTTFLFSAKDPLSRYTQLMEGLRA